MYQKRVNFVYEELFLYFPVILNVLRSSLVGKYVIDVVLPTREDNREKGFK